MAQYFKLTSTENGDLHYVDEDGNLFIAGTLYADAIDAAAISYGGAIPTGTNTGDQLIFTNVAVSGQSTVAADSTAATLTLVAGSGIGITTNAGADTITITGSAVSNSFVNVAVAGQSTVVADSTADTLTFVAGTNVSLTTDAGADSITINSTGGGGTFTLTGDVTGSGTGTVATTLADDSVITSKIADGALTTAKIADDAVTLAKIQDVNSQRILGRISSGTGQVEELTAANIRYVSETQAGRLAGGRLTLETVVPVSATDQTAKSTLYYTPYSHDQISLYDNATTKWLPYDFQERSIILSGLISGRNYDVFLFNNFGTLTLELTAWTNNTARASALGRLNGVLVKNSDYSRRYVGTIRTTSSSTTEDSITKRFVWNYDNRTERRIYKGEIVTHTYTTAAWRVWRGTSGTRCEFVVGWPDQLVHLEVAGQTTGSGEYCGVGIDGNIVDGAAGTFHNPTGSQLRQSASGHWFVHTPGYHYADAMQLATGGSSNYILGFLSGFLKC